MARWEKDCPTGLYEPYRSDSDGNRRLPRLRTVRMVNDVLKLSEGPMDVSAWDIDKDLIGLPGGAIWDLNASESYLNIHRLPVMRTAGADPERAGCPLGNPCRCYWHSFLNDVTGGGRDLADNLQLAVGASLFAGNQAHRINLVVGDGGTGKSTFLNAINKALGDYAGVAPAPAISGPGADDPTALAGVVDKRFVYVAETQGSMWRAGSILA